MVFVILLLSFSLNAQTLRVVTEDWAPFNYLQDGKPAGISVEICQAVLKEAGIEAKIELLPWNRAYDDAQKVPNVMIFAMGRNPDREKLFNWIYQIAPRESWFIKLKERTDITASKFDDLKKYKIGIGPKDDVTTQELVKLGFEMGKNLDSYQGEGPDRTNILKLFDKKVDLIAGNPIGLAYTARQIKMDFSKTEKVLLVSGSGGYWAAMSLNSNPELIKKIQTASAKLEKAGVFKTILDKYLK
jgi:polar amino acid transport system substrate-binding protein